MKKPQDHKKPKKQSNLDQTLKALQELRESKDLDMIADAIFELITLYGLKTDEVAAVNYYIMERTIKAKHNAELFKRELDLDVEELSIDGVLQVQRALVTNYVRKVMDSGRS